MEDFILTGVKRIPAILQPVQSVKDYVMDDDNNNLLLYPHLFKAYDNSISGDVKLLLWGDDEPTIHDVQEAHGSSLLVKKVYLTGTDPGITNSSFHLYA